jgi:hypothetical protein
MRHVVITETLVRVVPVNIDSDEAALEHVKQQYGKGEIVLEAEDYFDCSIDLARKSERHCQRFRHSYS